MGEGYYGEPLLGKVVNYEGLANRFDGRYASYKEGSKVVLGFLTEEPSEAEYLWYYDETPWGDIDSYNSRLELLLDIVKPMLFDPETAWEVADPSYPPYETTDAIIMDDEKGTVTFKVTATCAEYEVNEYYSLAAEEHVASIVFDAQTAHLVSIDYSMMVYDVGAVELDPDTEANNYYYRKVDGIVYGPAYDETVMKFNYSDFDPDVVSNYPGQIVSDIAEGAIAEDKVLEVMENLNAYAEGTSSIDSELYYLMGYDSAWNETGPYTQTYTAKLYNDYILDGTAAVDYELETDTDYTRHHQAYPNETGLIIVDQIGEDVQGSFIEGDEITSLSMFMGVSPVHTDYELMGLVSNLSQIGFGSTSDSWSSVTTSLTSASKTGSTMELKIKQTTVSDYSGEVTLDFTLVIEDDFLSSFEYVSSNGEYVRSTMGNDPLTDFTGSLIGFDPSTLY